MIKAKRSVSLLLALVLIFSVVSFATPMANAAGYAPTTGLFELRPSNATATRLDVTGGSTANKTNIQIYKSNGTLSQQFYLVKAAKDNYYYIVSRLSGKVLDVSGGKGKAGDNVIQYSCKRGKHQQWRFIATKGGYYLVPRVNESLALTAAGRNSGANVYVATRTKNNKNQIWAFGKSNNTSGLNGCTMSNPQGLTATFVLKTTGKNAKFTVDPLREESTTSVYKTTSCDVKVTIYSGGKVIKTQNISGSKTINIPKGYRDVTVKITANTGIIAQGKNFAQALVACQLMELQNCTMAR